MRHTFDWVVSAALSPGNRVVGVVEAFHHVVAIRKCNTHNNNKTAVITVAIILIITSATVEL